MRFRTKTLANLLTLIIVGTFIYYFANNANTLKGLLEVSLTPLIGIFFLKIVGIHNTGQYLRENLKIFNKNISAKESFYVSLLSSIGNYFGPYLGGAGVRAVYLRKKFDFSYTNFISTLSGVYLINLHLLSLTGLLSLALIQLTIGLYSLAFYMVFGGMFVVSVAISKIKFMPAIFKGNRVINRLSDKINEIIAGWHLLRSNTKVYKNLYLITLVSLLISYGVISLQFLAIGANVTVPATLLYVALTGLSLYLSITPGAIGIREGLFIFAGSLLGLTTEQILQLAVISRGMTFISMAAAYIYVKSVDLAKYGLSVNLLKKQ